MLADVEIAVGLFPGQGGYRRGALQESWSRGDESVRAGFEAVDAAGDAILGKSVSQRIFGSGAPAPEDLFLEDPELLQLAVFGVSASVFDMLRRRGARFSVLVGHSLGEIAALVCAGGLSIGDGAELICHRIAATTRVGSSTGGMLSLHCDEGRATQLVELVGDPDLVVAVVNGPSQVVLSGPRERLAAVGVIAEALRISSVPLLAPAAFHSPQMAGVRSDALRRLPAYRQHPLQLPVYSPILGRYYRDRDDLVELLGLHLITPVHFSAALGRLHQAGARVFVEVGAGGTLTGLVRSAFPDVAIAAPLASTSDEAGLSAAADLLRLPGPARGAVLGSVESATTGITAPVEVPAPVGVPAVDAHGGSNGKGDADGWHEPGLGNGVDDNRGPDGPASRAAILAEVRRIYAEALEYPEDVLTEDAHLEADLGIDSVKQVELLTRLGDHFQIGSPQDDFRVAQVATFGSVVDLVSASAGTGSSVAGSG